MVQTEGEPLRDAHQKGCSPDLELFKKNRQNDSKFLGAALRLN